MENSLFNLCSQQILRVLGGMRHHVACITLLLISLPTNVVAANISGQNIYSLSYFWVEDNGDAVQFSKWKGKSIILTMAYGECIRVCSSTLRKLEEAQNLANTLNQSIDFVIVSIDPKEDTPQSWYYYRKKHGLVHRENWHFLTGTESGTRRLANLMGIRYWMDEDHVIHDFKILRLDSEGDIQAYLDWDHQEVTRLFGN